VRSFFATRLEVIAKERGFAPDAVQAVLATDVIEPADVLARIATLSEARVKEPELFADLAAAYTRANNLRDAALSGQPDQALMAEPELELNAAIDTVAAGVAEALTAGRYNDALAQLATLRAPIDRFFIDVLVMDDDPALRQNRLLLLDKFVSVFTHVADFAKLAG